MSMVAQKKPATMYRLRVDNPNWLLDCCRSIKQGAHKDYIPGVMNLKDLHCTMNYDPDPTDLEWGIEWDEYFDGRHPGIQVSTLCIGKKGGAFLVDLPDSLKPFYMLNDISNPHLSIWVNTPFEQKYSGAHAEENQV